MVISDLPIEQVIYRIPLVTWYNNKPLNEVKSYRVGIRNLGCICYMNAVL